MKAFDILTAFEQVDDIYVDEAYAVGKASRKPLLRRTVAVALLVAGVLALCGFTAYELGWLDTWLQIPSKDPVETVRSAIENQTKKAYTLDVRIDELEVDEDETARVVAMYTGSDLAKSRGWTDDYLAARFVVVRASYCVRYDHTRTFSPDGDTRQYFYLAQDIKTGRWSIVDNTSPDTD